MSRSLCQRLLSNHENRSESAFATCGHTCFAVKESLLWQGVAGRELLVSL